MKLNAFTIFFIIITIACLTISGAASIALMYKSILLVFMLTFLLFIGVLHVVKQFDEEQSELT